MPEDDMVHLIVSVLVKHGYAGTAGDMLPDYQAHELATAIYRDVISGIVDSWMAAADHLMQEMDRAQEDKRAERSSRQAWATEALRLDVELERERRITSAYAEQVRMHLCSSGKPLTEPADPDKEWTLEELSGTVCGKTGEFTPDVCDGTCRDCQPRKPIDLTADDEDEAATCTCPPFGPPHSVEAAGPLWSLPQCAIHGERS